MCIILSSFRMAKPGPPADLFSPSSEAKSAGKDVNPIFLHIFVGPLAIGTPAELLCVPVYIWGMEGRRNNLHGLWQINVKVVQGQVSRCWLPGQRM